MDGTGPEGLSGQVGVPLATSNPITVYGPCIQKYADSGNDLEGPSQPVLLTEAVRRDVWHPKRTCFDSRAWQARYEMNARSKRRKEGRYVSTVKRNIVDWKAGVETTITWTAKIKQDSDLLRISWQERRAWPGL